MSIRLLSPAKLNLFLHICGRRHDGYHQLQTLFQLLDYGDDMTFALREDGQCLLTTPITGVANEDNLIIRAAKGLQQASGSLLGATISIDKRLPQGGGLGGGSSNAATTLVALNHLWQTALSKTQLCEIGLALGADVPLFIQGRSAWGEGIGEQLQAIDLPDYWYLVIKPDCEVSTGYIFSREELTRDTPAITVAAFFEQGGHNDCEKVVCSYYPEVKSALEWLGHYGPAQLTGTGACIFSSFETQGEAQAILEEVPTRWSAFVAKGSNHSPVLPLLL